MFVMCLSRSLRYQIKKQKSKWDLTENNPRSFQGDGPYYINVPKPAQTRHGVNNPAFDRSGP
jgi:hypothetical protein